MIIFVLPMQSLKVNNLIFYGIRTSIYVTDWGAVIIYKKQFWHPHFVLARVGNSDVKIV